MAVVKLKGKVRLNASINSLKASSSKFKHAVITIGIPCAGKTSWAEQQLGYNNISINDLRSRVGSNYNDKQIIEMHDAFLHSAMGKQQNIILSDTNIDPSYRQQLTDKLKAAGYTVEYKLFDVTLDEALKRNSSRKVKVKEDIIINLYKQLKEQGINGSSSK